MIPSLHQQLRGAFARLERSRGFVPKLENGSGRLSRADLEPVLQHFGITRVGKITELDDIGVPVWAAIRPASRSLSVSAGKGTTDEAAWTSAVMESCEQAVAEDVGRVVALVETVNGMARRGLKSIPLERQSRCAASHINPDRELAWVKGMSWCSGETVFAPYELIGMDMLAIAPWDTDVFKMTSSGLSSGADLRSAILHGLHELVEDDALFAALLPRRPSASGAIGFDRRQGVELAKIVDRLSGAGVQARFARLGDEAGPPVIAAAVVPSDGAGEDRAYFSGIACAASVESAALSALLEAIQCRAIFISGARDDLDQDDYALPLTESTRALFSPFHFDAETFDRGVGTLESTVATITRMTGGDIYVFPLGGREFGFEVVRVLADDLVSIHAPSNYPRSGRAAELLLRQWAKQ